MRVAGAAETEVGAPAPPASPAASAVAQGLAGPPASLKLLRGDIEAQNGGKPIGEIVIPVADILIYFSYFLSDILSDTYSDICDIVSDILSVA